MWNSPSASVGPFRPSFSTSYEFLVVHISRAKSRSDTPRVTVDTLISGVGGFELCSGSAVLVFGWLVLFRLRWFCLPCVRCLVLLCVALRSFCVFRSG